MTELYTALRQRDWSRLQQALDTLLELDVELDDEESSSGEYVYRLQQLSTPRLRQGLSELLNVASDAIAEQQQWIRSIPVDEEGQYEKQEEIENLRRKREAYAEIRSVSYSMRTYGRR